VKRISNNRDLFEANTGETITVTISASKTPYQVTFSSLESSGQWTVTQQPTPATPIEKRQFTMPGGAREFFAIVYAFPPADQTDPDAKYSISFASNDGTRDLPEDVFPPVAGDIDNLPYEFQLPAH
jgi:hypothetical protein